MKRCSKQCTACPYILEGRNKKINRSNTWKINKRLDKATGAHFHLPGHSPADLRCTVLEQGKVNSDLYRKEREKYFINKFDTLNEGLNRKK